jgi:mRNA interferase RelE/StbE
MTYVVVWRNEARRALSSLRALDRTAAKTVADALRALGADPYPEASNRLGGSRFWRLRLGQFRVTYEIDRGGLAV